MPLGFGRVYVECPRGFSFESWWKGLNEGRSFVTTGPMLLGIVNGQPPGAHMKWKEGESRHIRIRGEVISSMPVNSVEIIVNGQIVRSFVPRSGQNRDGASYAKFRQAIELSGSSWIALRCWEACNGGRIRFAHTAPWFFDVAGAPLQPRHEDSELLIRSVQREIDRSSSLLPAEALAEYQKALSIYQDISRRAR